MTRYSGSDQSCSRIPFDVVHRFRYCSKSGRHTPESVDDLLRIWWTTCSGLCIIPDQFGPFQDLFRAPLPDQGNYSQKAGAQQRQWHPKPIFVSNRQKSKRQHCVPLSKHAESEQHNNKEYSNNERVCFYQELRYCQRCQRHHCSGESPDPSPAPHHCHQVEYSQ